MEFISPRWWRNFIAWGCMFFGGALMICNSIVTFNYYDQMFSAITVVPTWVIAGTLAGVIEVGEAALLLILFDERLLIMAINGVRESMGNAGMNISGNVAAFISKGLLLSLFCFIVYLDWISTSETVGNQDMAFYISMLFVGGSEILMILAQVTSSSLNVPRNGSGGGTSSRRSSGATLQDLA